MSKKIEGRRNALEKVELSASTNAGLWLDKYPTEVAAKIAIPDGYARAYERRRALLEELDGGIEEGVTRLYVAEARGRIVVGLGAHSVTETGITLLHTWGVPYLPGTALHGMASAVAHQLSGEAAWRKATKVTPQGDEHRILFGDTTDAGCVVFHDAWWIPETANAQAPLDADVMTVHHAAYYRDGAEAPADWDEPTPIPFLTAHGRYLIALTGPEGWIEHAAAFLNAGLEALGIGAKTAAGYGRMACTPEPTRREGEARALREKHEASLATLANLPVQHKGAGTAKQHIGQLRQAIAEGVPPSEVYTIARKLTARDEKFWKNWVRDARRTEEERAFLIESGMVAEWLR